MATDQNDLVYITIAIEPEGDGAKLLPLRQSVAELEDEYGETVGKITTTAGLGGDMVLLEWQGRRGKVRMSYLLREWVRSFDAAGARRLPIEGPDDVSD